ncbi:MULTISPECIES: hypothetical protein [Kitasatospora]|uniref:Uncharacterized protein n=1 Tax=Kitasatospora setae (strain ATCC 33774 / DSM 43861 / JCM 3304 / KCC A-0304 / NBRC 14216 / KM-6054) TaxID=452652 RepID=E4N5X4_KITSK|nr:MULTISPECIES: hypothetical protein [Kitasatospora]BAJ26605.1 hypothetical protein KSE_07650 [Kitasatospora setae KM-6054]
MRFRTAAKAATTLAIAGGLTVAVAGVAFAAPTNLTGKGCPSSYVNNADGGTWTQTLTKKFIAPNGFQYGDYKVTFRTPAGSLSNEGIKEYRCY